MQLFTLLLLWGATAAFYDTATISQIVEDHNPNEPTETLECCICFDDCVKTSLDRAKEEDKLFLTDLFSCENPKHLHFYHKNCLIEWIFRQDDKSMLRCPVCQEVTSINIVSLVKDEGFLILTGKASFYPEFIELIYGILKSNIFAFLSSKSTFANLELFRRTIETLETIKCNLNEMSSWLDKIMSYESEYRDEALDDFKHVLYILKNPCSSYDALLEEVDKYVTDATKHEEKITFLLLNFFTTNKPEEFVPKLQAHAGNSPHHWQILNLVFDKFAQVCFNKDEAECLIDSLMCSEKYWDISENSKVLLEEFPLLPLLEKKINSSLAWIAQEQRSLAITRSIRFCARHSEEKKLKSFLLKMIDNCFRTKIQSLEKKQYIPKNQFMIDFIADFYQSKQQEDTVEEYPWFVYDFICAKIIEEAPQLKFSYYDIYTCTAADESIYEREEKKEYYFLNVLLDNDHQSVNISTEIMENLANANNQKGMSLRLRHCFSRDNARQLFGIADSKLKNSDSNKLFSELMKQEECLNFKNQIYLDKFITKQHLCNTIGLWRNLPDKQIDTFCEQSIQKGDYEEIKTLIFGCDNMNIIKMLNDEAIEKIISSSDFFARLPIMRHFFELQKKSSLFVRHNFIKIFEMGCEKYAGVNYARVLLLLKHLNVIGFNGSESFKKYKPIFKYLSQRNDAFYLLNTGRKSFSRKLNHDMALYITKLLRQSNSLFDSKHAEINKYKYCFDNWQASIFNVTRGSFESWKLQCAFTWCDKIDKQDACGKEWNPYTELENSGTDIIKKMEKDNSSSYSFARDLTSFIPRCVVNKIQERIRIKSQK
ncbi:hypothetical protein ENBRE01_0415 [Enteropsectra breve]|nr:hypothetical protein ENBRE01_0415 [Enteropsectra breve]